MYRCPECSSQYYGDLKTCPACGAILKEVVEESPHEENNPHETTSAKQHSWTCLQCGQSVPGSFEVCWNCGASQDGIPDLEFHKEPPAAKEYLGPQVALDQAAVKRACPRCGSSRIIPDTRILDSSAYSHNLQVVVDADPDALVFKDRRYDQVNADICGDCGHVELKVEHPRELYEHYLRSKHQPAT
jgi:hypothetical protein